MSRIAMLDLYGKLSRSTARHCPNEGKVEEARQAIIRLQRM